MTTIALVSQKGGVGKTTLAVNLSYSLARRGWNVLLVDADLQGGVGFSLTEKSKDATGYYDFLTGESEFGGNGLDSAILRTKLPGLSLLTRGSREALDAALGDPHGQWASDEQIAAVQTRLLRQRFDLVIYDTATGAGRVTMGLCRHVDYIVSPQRPEPLCLRSLPQILRMVASVKAGREEGEGPQLGGFVLSMADPEAPSNLEDQREFRDLLPVEFVFETVIPEHGDLGEASRAGVPVAMLRARPSPSALIFDQLAAELETRLNLCDDQQGASEPRHDYARLVD